MNNTSMFTADRATHMKIVVLSLMCAIVVAAVGITARVADSAVSGGRYEATAIKAGKPMTASTIERTAIR